MDTPVIVGGHEFERVHGEVFQGAVLCSTQPIPLSRVADLAKEWMDQAASNEYWAYCPFRTDGSAINVWLVLFDLRRVEIYGKHSYLRSFERRISEVKTFPPEGEKWLPIRIGNFACLHGRRWSFTKPVDRVIVRDAIGMGRLSFEIYRLEHGLAAPVILVKDVRDEMPSIPIHELLVRYGALGLQMPLTGTFQWATLQDHKLHWTKFRELLASVDEDVALPKGFVTQAMELYLRGYNAVVIRATTSPYIQVDASSEKYLDTIDFVDDISHHRIAVKGLPSEGVYGWEHL